VAAAVGAKFREPGEWPDVSACEHEMIMAEHSKDFPPKSIEKYSALNAVWSKDSSSSSNNSVATRYEKTALNFLAGLQLVCAPPSSKIGHVRELNRSNFFLLPGRALKECWHLVLSCA
jgi:hypothetical protein